MNLTRHSSAHEVGTPLCNANSPGAKDSMVPPTGGPGSDTHKLEVLGTKHAHIRHIKAYFLGRRKGKADKD